MEFFLESSFSFDDCAMHSAVYNGSKLDGSDRVPLSECLISICYCRVSRYSGNFAVRDVFLVGVTIHFRKDIQSNSKLHHMLFTI
jgi:hypothetical protein